MKKLAALSILISFTAVLALSCSKGDCFKCSYSSIVVTNVCRKDYATEQEFEDYKNQWSKYGLKCKEY